MDTGSIAGYINEYANLEIWKLGEVMLEETRARLGCTGLPVRWGSPPEISRITIEWQPKSLRLIETRWIFQKSSSLN